MTRNLKHRVRLARFNRRVHGDLPLWTVPFDEVVRDAIISANAQDYQGKRWMVEQPVLDIAEEHVFSRLGFISGQSVETTRFDEERGKYINDKGTLPIGSVSPFIIDLSSRYVAYKVTPPRAGKPGISKASFFAVLNKMVEPWGYELNAVAGFETFSEWRDTVATITRVRIHMLPPNRDPDKDFEALDDLIFAGTKSDDATIDLKGEDIDTTSSFIEPAARHVMQRGGGTLSADALDDTGDEEHFDSKEREVSEVFSAADDIDEQAFAAKMISALGRLLSKLGLTDEPEKQREQS